jgi:hypothetical protein
MFEHRWAEHLKDAIKDAGGFLVARETIPPEIVAAISADTLSVTMLPMTPFATTAAVVVTPARRALLVTSTSGRSFTSRGCGVFVLSRPVERRSRTERTHDAQRNPHHRWRF